MKSRWRTVFIAIGILIILVFCGTCFFTISENWSLVESFYFTMMTITTVGYGDYVPSHDISKIVTVCYSLVSIPVVLFIFGFFAEHYFEKKIIDLELRLKNVIEQERQIKKEIEAYEEKKEGASG